MGDTTAAAPTAARNGTRALTDRVGQIAANLVRAAAILKADAKQAEIDAFPDIYTYLQAEQRKLSRLRRRPGANEPEYLPPNHGDVTTTPTAFGSQLEYLHNEFNFDAARPIRNWVLATHISFLPIFEPKWPATAGRETPRPEGRSEAELQRLHIPASVQSRYEELVRRAVHDGEGFSGGKDSVNSRLNRFLDYDRKIITTMRSVERMYDSIISQFSGPDRRKIPRMVRNATKWNKDLQTWTQARGLSSRLSMMREYALRLERDQSTRLTWVRHHSHYQTITAIEEARISAAQAVGIDSLDIRTTPTLESVLNRLRAIDLDAVEALHQQSTKNEDRALSHTAFDSFPSDWADHIFGRYLQGANYLFLPADFLFSKNYLQAAEGLPRWFRNGEEGLAAEWRRLLAASGHDPALDASLGYDRFLTIWTAAQSSPAISRACSQFLFSLMLPLIVCSFPQGRSIDAQEFCFCAANDGGAAILSNVRNMTSFSTEEAGKMLFSETVVVDFGMNDFERGRLFKQLSEFSTERMRSLAALGTFRFLSDALEAVHNKLAEDIKTWLKEIHVSNNAARGRGRRPYRATEQEVQGDRNFAQTLKDTTIDLTILNDLVDGGISAHSAAVATAVERVRTRLGTIGEKRCVGFMSLTEFLQRRFYRSVKIVAAVGDRYDLLRRRVAELSTLVETHVEMNQRDDQRTLLAKVDRLTLFGITYYFGMAIAYILAPILVEPAQSPLAHYPVDNLEHMIDLVKFGAFSLLIIGGIVLGLDVIVVLRDEVVAAPGNWARAIKIPEFAKLLKAFFQRPWSALKRALRLTELSS